MKINHRHHHFPIPRHYMKTVTNITVKFECRLNVLNENYGTFVQSTGSFPRPAAKMALNDK